MFAPDSPGALQGQSGSRRVILRFIRFSVLVRADIVASRKSAGAADAAPQAFRPRATRCVKRPRR